MCVCVCARSCECMYACIINVCMRWMVVVVVEGSCYTKRIDLYDQDQVDTVESTNGVNKLWNDVT